MALYCIIISCNLLFCRLTTLQIVMGISSFIFQIALLASESKDSQGADGITYASYGIWMGLIVRMLI